MERMDYVPCSLQMELTWQPEEVWRVERQVCQKNRIKVTCFFLEHKRRGSQTHYDPSPVLLGLSYWSGKKKIAFEWEKEGELYDLLASYLVLFASKIYDKKDCSLEQEPLF